MLPYIAYMDPMGHNHHDLLRTGLELNFGDSDYSTMQNSTHGPVADEKLRMLSVACCNHNRRAHQSFTGQNTCEQCSKNSVNPCQPIQDGPPQL